VGFAVVATCFGLLALVRMRMLRLEMPVGIQRDGTRPGLYEKLRPGQASGGERVGARPSENPQRARIVILGGTLVAALDRDRGSRRRVCQAGVTDEAGAERFSHVGRTVRDPEGTLAKDLGVPGTPFGFAIDPQGVVRNIGLPNTVADVQKLADAPPPADRPSPLSRPADGVPSPA
jgi:hypothetical protein